MPFFFSVYSSENLIWEVVLDLLQSVEKMEHPLGKKICIKHALQGNTPP